MSKVEDVSVTAPLLSSEQKLIKVLKQQNKEQLLRGFFANVRKIVEEKAKYLPKDLGEIERQKITNPYIFFSYAWEPDKSTELKNLQDFLISMKSHLEAAELPVFFDLECMSGEMPRAMNDNIKAAQYVFLFGTLCYGTKTAEGMKTNAREELLFAKEEFKKTKDSDYLQPILLEGKRETIFPGTLFAHDCTSWYSLQHGWSSFDNYITGLTQCSPLGILPTILGLNRKNDFQEYRRNCLEAYRKEYELFRMQLKRIDDLITSHRFQDEKKLSVYSEISEIEEMKLISKNIADQVLIIPETKTNTSSSMTILPKKSSPDEKILKSSPEVIQDSKNKISRQLLPYELKQEPYFFKNQSRNQFDKHIVESLLSYCQQQSNKKIVFIKFFIIIGFISILISQFNNNISADLDLGKIGKIFIFSGFIMAICHNYTINKEIEYIINTIGFNFTRSDAPRSIITTSTSFFRNQTEFSAEEILIKKLSSLREAQGYSFLLKRPSCRQFFIQYTGEYSLEVEAKLFELPPVLKQVLINSGIKSELFEIQENRSNLSFTLKAESHIIDSMIKFLQYAGCNYLSSPSQVQAALFREFKTINHSSIEDEELVVNCVMQ